MALLLTEDFTGRYNVSLNKFEENDLMLYISDIQDIWLTDLLGCDLKALFDADLVADSEGRDVPQSAEYLAIYNAICDDDLTCCCNYYGTIIDKKVKSYGMLDLFKSITRFYFLRDQKYKQTISGTVVSDNENSTVIKSLHYGLTKQYNKGVESYQAIQCYINKNKNTYPTYKGCNKNFLSWL